MAFNFPDPQTTPEFTADNGITYSWDVDDSKWQIKRYAADFDDRYVNEEGDTMTGDLVMDDADILMDNGDIEFEAKGDTAFIQNINNRFGKIVSRAPKDTEVDSTDFTSEFGIKVDLNEGSTNKNRLKVGNSTGDIITISSGGGPQIVLGGNEFTGSPGQSGLTGGVPILGVPTPDFENSPGDIAVNKEYVDARDEILQQEIIELEEEIEAIAPSVERGSWNFNLLGTVSGPGVFTAYDQYVATSGSPIGLVTNIKSIWFHSIDNAGTPHGFDNVEPGNLLQLFVEGEEEYGLFEVVEVHDFTDGAGDYWVIDVDFVRTLENITRFDNSETCRLNIFKAPEGGTADGFVLKTGDTMSGELEIKTPDYDEAAITLHGKRDNTKNSSATVAFKNQLDTAEAYAGYLTYRTDGSSAGFFRFNQDVDLNNNALRQVGQIRMQPGGYIGSGENQRLTFHNATSGNEGEGLLVVPRPADNRRGFSIRGNNADGTEKDMLFSFTNTGKPDAVNYDGKMDSGTNLVNKAYVDDEILTNKTYVDDKITELLAKIEELEMAGAMTNYQFQMDTKRYYNSGGIGKVMYPNAIASSTSIDNFWTGSNTKAVAQADRYIYVCLPDDTYQLNSQGGFTAVQSQGNGAYRSQTPVLSFNISNVEKCPESYAFGKSIWRAEAIPIDHKSSSTTFLSSFDDDNILYVTFNGGSVTKTSA